MLRLGVQPRAAVLQQLSDLCCWMQHSAAAAHAATGCGPRGSIRLNSGVPLSWLRGRNPVLPSERFDAKWQQQGVLYTVAGGLGPRLTF